MKNLIKLWLLAFFIAGSVSAQAQITKIDLTIVNLVGTNIITHGMNFPVGVTKFSLPRVGNDDFYYFVSVFAGLPGGPLTLKQDGKYQVTYLWTGAYITYNALVISDYSIQDALNRGLYFGAGIVGVLLAFSIIRTIPGGGHEEI